MAAGPGSSTFVEIGIYGVGLHTDYREGVWYASASIEGRLPPRTTISLFLADATSGVLRLRVAAHVEHHNTGRICGNLCTSITAVIDSTETGA